MHKRRDVKPMIETVLLAFIIARIRKNKLLPIFKHWSIYPVIFMALIYIYLESMIWQGDYSLIKYANVFKTAYLSSLLILAIHYDRMNVFLYSTPLIWIGTSLNVIAMRANGGKMPVFVSNSWATGYAKPDMFEKTLAVGDFHIIGNMYSNLIPICDTWDFGWCVMSIGDIIVRSFVFLVIYYCIKESNKKLQIYNLFH